MRTAIRQLFYDLADIATDMVAQADGYPGAHPDDGRVNEDAFVNAKSAADIYGNQMQAARSTDFAEPGPAVLAADINGIPHHEYQRQREEERKWARTRALELALGSNEDRPVDADRVLMLADRLYGFIYCGAVPEAPVVLANVPTDALVAELSNRVS